MKQALKSPTVLILLLSCLVACVCGIRLYYAPSIDGDSYEYATVTRNLVRHGSMTNTHVQAYFSGLQPIERPAWNRANLQTLILVPFYLIFGDSPWTFYLPYLIVLVLTPLVVFRFANRWFGPTIAWFTSIACLIHPRILAWSSVEDPGQPDLLGMVLFLLALDLFLQRKYLWFGLTAGLAFLLKHNGILTPVLLFAGLALSFNFKSLANRRLWAGLALAVLLFSALFIRNVVVFGHPLYSDQFSSRRGTGEGGVESVKHGSAIRTMFELEKQPIEGIALDFTLETRLKFAYYNAPKVLYELYNLFGYYPGMILLLFYVLVPFLLIGSGLLMKFEWGRITVVWMWGHLLFIIGFKAGFEDRYLFCVLPAMLAVSAYGLIEAGKRLNLAKAAKAFLFLLLATETIFALFLLVLGMNNPDDAVFREELDQSYRYLKERTPPDSVVMTIPLFAPHFLADRPTVPVPMGPFEDMRTVITHYGVDYLLLGPFWPGDHPPYYSFLQKVLPGKRVNLYKVDSDPRALDDYEARYPFMADFNLFAFFFVDRFSWPVDPTNLQLFGIFWGPAGWLLWLAILAASAGALSVDGKRARRIPAIVLAVTTLGLLATTQCGQSPQRWVVLLTALTLLLLALRKNRPVVHLTLALFAIIVMVRVTYLEEDVIAFEQMSRSLVCVEQVRRAATYQGISDIILLDPSDHDQESIKKTVQDLDDTDLSASLTGLDAIKEPFWGISPGQGLVVLSDQDSRLEASLEEAGLSSVRVEGGYFASVEPPAPKEEASAE